MLGLPQALSRGGWGAVSLIIATWCMATVSYFPHKSEYRHGEINISRKYKYICSFILTSELTIILYYSIAPLFLFDAYTVHGVKNHDLLLSQLLQKMHLVELVVIFYSFSNHGLFLALLF